jgi:hypothetical protein
VKPVTRRLTLVALVSMTSLAVGYPSAEAACPALDLACELDEATDTSESLVNDTIDPIETPLDDSIDPVLDPIVDDVFDRVDDPLGGGGPIDPPDPIDGGDGGSHGTGRPVGEGPPSTPTNPPGPGSRSVFGGRIPDGPGITGPAGPVISAASGIAPLTGADRTSGNRFGEALRGVARSLAIVLALFGLAVAFVAVQDRLDRNDPRLALAPVESDVVEFA